MKSLFAVLTLTAVPFYLGFSFYSKAGSEGEIRLHLRGAPSHRDLLHRKASPYSLHENHIDTLRILAIRVEFVPDTLAETTGDGRFVMTSPETPTIDPPPHDRRYFEAQLQALANYYYKVSNGKLVLLWDVYPRENEAAYQLDKPMIYYAPGPESEEADRRLAELFRDGFLLADRQDNIPFSQYDSFILFHAGVGNDLRFDFDPTPNDIPSAFLNLDDLRTNLAPDDPGFQGIAVQGGSYYIQDGIILPETQSQEGFEIGLLGTAAIMMGFQIGLPALYDLEKGTSGIGRWGLMDQGSGNFQGMLPAEPSAWEKVYMGWEKPIVVYTADSLKVAAPREPLSPNRIYKIPINDDEYFLIENRQRDVNGDQIAIGRDTYGNRVEFKDPGQILADTTIGVIVEVDEYDFGLPGSGILIWHIDEAVIREKLADNRINSDPERRGVDLEEADGAQDIGRIYGFLHPGSGSENGVPEDAWHRDNPINKLVNNSDKVEFGPDTQPSSRSNDGANSYIVITDFSENRPLMSFSVKNSRILAGFPQYVGQDFLPIMAADLVTELPGSEIVLLRRDGAVVVVDGQGREHGGLSETHTIASPGNEQRTYTVRKILDLGAKFSNPPAFGDVDGDGNDEMILASDDGILRVYRFQWQSGRQMLPEPLWSIEVPEKYPAWAGYATAQKLVLWANGQSLRGYDASGTETFSFLAGRRILHAAIAPDAVLLATENELILLDAATQAVKWRIAAGNPQAVAIADFESNGELTYIVRETSGEIRLIRSNGQEIRTIVPPWLGPAGMSVADVDGDGFKDLVLVYADRIEAINRAGARLEGFPRLFPGPGEPVERGQEALLLRSKVSSWLQIAFAAPSGNIYLLGQSASLADGFPFAFSAAPENNLAAADVNGDGEIDLLALSDAGFLTAISLPGMAPPTDHPWTVYGGDPAQQRRNVLQFPAGVANGELLPAHLAYNYPNPTENGMTTIRYRLNGEAKVIIQIFDLAGELVQEFSGPAVPNADNEIPWSVSAIQSGVYLARIEARSANKREVVTFKIAVVK